METFDVVIPLKEAPHDYAELRYCLRSIQKYLDGLGRIFIVGNRPDWLQPDGQHLIHLPIQDLCCQKDVSIWNKLFLTCVGRSGVPNVSERFLFWSDDQVLLRPVGWQQFGPYHYGDLADWTAWPQDGIHDAWWQRMRHTVEYLKSHEKTTLHGDIHIPIPMERSWVIRITQEADWRTAPGLCVGTVYLNWTGESSKAKRLDAPKATINRPMDTAELRQEIAGRWFLTWTEEGFTENLRQVLDETFSEPKITVSSSKTPKLSIIIPTIGRATLRRTLESIRSQQLVEGDEVILVQDGPPDESIKRLLMEYHLPGWYDATGKQSNDSGATPRNFVIPRARGDFLLFMDDDDVYLPGALQIVRRSIMKHGKRPLMFRMRWLGTTIWKTQEVRYGNVSTQMGCIPNLPGRLSAWPSYRGNDYAFYLGILAHWPPGSLVWCPEVIVDVNQVGSKPVWVDLLTRSCRNLLYHIYPRKDNEEWQLNVKQLLDYWAIFNGRKVIGVALDEMTDDLKTVQRAFPSDPAITWVPYTNQPILGEVPTFRMLMILHSFNVQEFTFFAHTKGVISPNIRLASSATRHIVLENIRQWRHWMYRGCLEWDLKYLNTVLYEYGCSGCFRVPNRFLHCQGRLPSYWYFSGTFFWVNHGRYFGSPYAMQLSNGRWAVEQHPGQVFALEESYCFLVDNLEREKGGCYNWGPQDWEKVEEEFFQKKRIKSI